MILYSMFGINLKNKSLWCLLCASTLLFINTFSSYNHLRRFTLQMSKPKLRRLSDLPRDIDRQSDPRVLVLSYRIYCMYALCDVVS